MDYGTFKCAICGKEFPKLCKGGKKYCEECRKKAKSVKTAQWQKEHYKKASERIDGEPRYGNVKGDGSYAAILKKARRGNIYKDPTHYAEIQKAETLRLIQEGKI